MLFVRKHELGCPYSTTYIFGIYSDLLSSADFVFKLTSKIFREYRQSVRKFNTQKVNLFAANSGHCSKALKQTFLIYIFYEMMHG